MSDYFEYKGITLRRVVEADLQPLQQLINEAYAYQDAAKGEPRINERSLRKRVAESEFYVATNGQQLLGCVYVKTDGYTLHLGLLAARPEQRGSGLAPALMDAVERYGQARGMTLLELDYMSLAPWLKKYYERYGFTETGRVKDWGPVSGRQMTKII